MTKVLVAVTGGLLAASATLAQQPAPRPTPLPGTVPQREVLRKLPPLPQGTMSGVVPEDQIKRCDGLQDDLHRIASSLANARKAKDPDKKIDAAISAFQDLVRALERAHIGCPPMIVEGEPVASTYGTSRGPEGMSQASCTPQTAPGHGSGG